MAGVLSLTGGGATPTLTGNVNVISANPFITVGNNAGSNAISLQYLNTGFAGLSSGSSNFNSGVVNLIAGSNMTLTPDNLANTITFTSASSGGSITYGEWVSATAYVVGEVVLFGNSTWICIQNVSGGALTISPPSSPTFWAPLGAVGNQAQSNLQISAAASLPASNASSWNSNTQYLRGDVVNYTDDPALAVAPSSLGYQYLCIADSVPAGATSGPGNTGSSNWVIQNRTWQTQGAQYMGTAVGEFSAFNAVTPAAPVIPHGTATPSVSFGYNFLPFTTFSDGGGSGGGIGTFIGTATLTYSPGSNLGSVSWVGLQLFDTAGQTTTSNIPPSNTYSFSTYYPFSSNLQLANSGGGTLTSPTVECKIITCPQVNSGSGGSSYDFTLAPVFTVSGGNDASFNGNTPTMRFSGGLVFTPTANSINPAPPA
jgi:hypothetical protein